MKSHTKHIHTLIIALALPFSALAAVDGDRKPDQPKTADDKKDETAKKAEMKFMGPITAVDREKMMITIDDAKMGKHMLHVSDKTKLMMGEKKATWDALKVGAKVEGTCMDMHDKDNEKHKGMHHAMTLMVKE